LMDVSRLADMGWRASVDLRNGLEETYQWYLKTGDTARH
ncbi:GDP-L-fucose synthase, partial [Marivivens donghaensis]|nr:GDP-L-fucose synthase [Marivivens donghaensis]NIY74013.1 GDP-L-fucose synthase [Marivivens donghaensis]